MTLSRHCRSSARCRAPFWLQRGGLVSVSTLKLKPSQSSALFWSVRPCYYDRQVTSLSVADQLVLRQTDRPHCRPASPAALVLTVNVAGLLFARLFALVEGKLSGKEVLFTLVIERLLRKRRRRGDGVKKRRKRGRRLMWVWTE